MFNRSSFSPVSFSHLSFNGVRAANEGRSGYWRLFYYQMQEEALKKNEQTAKLVTPETVVGAGKKQQKLVVPKKRKTVEAPAEVEYIPPFRRKPDYGPTVEEKQLEHAWLLSISIQQTLLQVAPMYLKLREQKASNDEDFNRLFLLMVA